MTGQAEAPGSAHESHAGTAAERRRVVASKLAAPGLRPGIVDRPDLLDSLQAAEHTPVVLVSAPAGYGKTTLLALWRARDERPFAWLSLDGVDNDPVALVAGILRAFGPILDLDPALSEALAAPDPPLEEVVLPGLADACAAADRPFVLVLDDLHLVTDARCLGAVGYLAERVPARSRVALATRTDPAAPIARLRAHGHLVEVRAGDLSLSETDAEALLSASGVSLSSDRVAQLVERTEGWPAALYLAGLSLRGRAEPDAFVDRFAGTSRHVADFLTEDVLARQPEDVIAFLLHTSLLEELTPSLCDALTGRGDADAMLRELERTNLFVVPLDEDRVAYRYHHLFAQYLRAELARREPALVPELHGRAWRWYREHGLIGRAVAHAQACDDVSAAIEMISPQVIAMTEIGQFETVRSWFDGFDDLQVERHAPLAVGAAWLASLAGETERAAHFTQAARRGAWEGPMPDGTASLESALALLSSAFGLGGLTGMRGAAEQAVAFEAAGSPWRLLSLTLLGVALTLDHELPPARAALAEAVQLIEGPSAIGSIALSYLARVNLFEGDEPGAYQHVERAFQVVERPGYRTYVPSICTYAIAAELLRRRGDLEGAALAVSGPPNLLPRVTEVYWWQMIESRILLVPVLVALGRRQEAITRYEEAGALLVVHDDAGRLPERLEQGRRLLRVERRTPQPSDELSDAERRILRLLATDLTLRDIGRELYVSLNTVKSHTRAIYRKLDVSSRSEAVRAGTERGELRLTERSDSPG